MNDEVAVGTRFTARMGPIINGGLCVTQTPAGTTVLVAGGIEGEEAVVEVAYRRARTWFGHISELLQASDERVTPLCRYVPTCGGCQLQHIAPSRQIHVKERIVREQLERRRIRTSHLKARLHPAADAWRYRWRGEFHVVPPAHPDGGTGLGFNRARSWTPIAVDDCLIHHSSISRSLPALAKASAATPGLHTLHLTVGGDAGMEVLISPSPPRAADHFPVTEPPMPPPPDITWSTSTTSLSWRGMHFRVAPESFIQVNRAMIETLYGTVLAALGDYSGKRIADAYGGIGVLGIYLAQKAASVVCIENNPFSVQMGRLNAKLNEIDAIEFDLNPVEQSLLEQMRKAPFDVVILDPPRAGCDTRVTAALALAGPPQVIYLSCDPATLARDLDTLTVSGPYSVESIDIVDMFPQTYHVETVVTLRRTTPAESADEGTGGDE